MSLITRINDLASRVATEFNTLRGLILPYDDSTAPTTGQTLEFDGDNFVPANAKASHYQIISSEAFDVDNVLQGWTQPTGVVDQSTAIVEFSNGSGRFQFASSSWGLVQFDYTGIRQVDSFVFDDARSNGVLVESGHAVTFKGKYFRTYYTWMGDTDLTANVAYYDHETKTRSPIYGWGIPQSGANDTHAAPGIAFTNEGYLVLIQEQLIGTSNHNSPIHIRRSDNPEDITSWSAISGSPFSDGLSYVHINKLQSGRIILHIRRFSSQVKSFISDDGLAWTNFDGTAISSSNSTTPAIISLEDGFWAYHNTVQLPDGVGLTVFPRHPSVTAAYPIGNALFTKDGITYGNWLWYLGDPLGWSKDVTSSPITKAELNANCIIIGDAAQDDGTIRNYAPRMTIQGGYLAFTYDKRFPIGGSTDTRFAVIDKDNNLISDHSLTNNSPYTGLDIGLPTIYPIDASSGQYYVFVRVSDGRVVQMITNDGGANFTHVRDLFSGGATDNERGLYQYVDVFNNVLSLNWISSEGAFKSINLDLRDGANIVNHTHTTKQITDFEIAVSKSLAANQLDARISGFVSNSDTSTSGMGFVVDEDDMSSDSNTKVPTQQSVKAYVDANAGGGGAAVMTDFDGFNVRNVSATQQAIPYNSATKVTVNNTLDYDTLSGWNAGLSRYTPSEAGNYLVTGLVSMTNIADGRKVIAMVYKNGAQYMILGRGVTGGASLSGYGGAAIIPMNGTTDYIELWAYTDDLDGAALYTSVDGYQNFSATLLKAGVGEGVPPGGTTGQVLAKASNSDYDTEWVTP